MPVRLRSPHMTSRVFHICSECEAAFEELLDLYAHKEEHKNA